MYKLHYNIHEHKIPLVSEHLQHITWRDLVCEQVTVLDGA